MTMVGKEKQLVQRAERLKALLAWFPNITQQKLGKVAGTRAQLPLKEGAIPVFMKSTSAVQPAQQGRNGTEPTGTGRGHNGCHME